MAERRAVSRSKKRKTAAVAVPSGRDVLRYSVAAGQKAAEAVLARREKRLGAVIAAPPRGLLVAEGDSWFDYPWSDVLEELEDRHRWEIVSVAHHGDTIESIAYDQRQLFALERTLRRLADAGRRPKAVLVSGGGNDIAGEEFSMLLNHKASGLPALNARVLEGVFDERIRGAMVYVLASVTRLTDSLFGGAKVPIVLHGYGYAVPDGRGFLGGFAFLPGPWLEPGFRRKGFADLQEATDLMALLIDRFNGLVSGIAGAPGFGHVRYVDVRPLLSNALAQKAYQRSWANELHPTKKGFVEVAKKLDGAISTLP